MRPGAGPRRVDRRNDARPSQNACCRPNVPEGSIPMARGAPVKKGGAGEGEARGRTAPPNGESFGSQLRAERANDLMGRKSACR